MRYIVAASLAVVMLLADVSEVSANTVTPQRLEKFLRKHKVVKPVYYAALIHKRIRNDNHRKIMAAILIPESRGKTGLVSSEGAVGPWQLHPCWFKKYGRASSPERNLAACYDVFLIHLKDEGSLNKALFAYSGRSSWYSKKINKLMGEI